MENIVCIRAAALRVITANNDESRARRLLCLGFPRGQTFTLVHRGRSRLWVCCTFLPRLLPRRAALYNMCNGTHAPFTHSLALLYILYSVHSRSTSRYSTRLIIWKIRIGLRVKNKVITIHSITRSVVMVRQDKALSCLLLLICPCMLI